MGRLFAATYAAMSPSLEAGPIGRARGELVARARGVVVDLGSGTGLNLRLLGAGVTAVHAVEPDPHMLRRLDVAGVRPPVEVHRIGAERLPFATASVDTVLATLTLCTVDDPVAVAAEIRRVLRADGRLLVLEHVVDDDARIARWQRRVAPLWRVLGGGCRADRDTLATLDDARLAPSDVRRFELPRAFPARIWVTGSLAPV